MVTAWASRARAVLLVLVLPASFPVASHPEDDWAAIHSQVQEWALALQNHDAATMEGLLHPEFRSRADLLPGGPLDLVELLRARRIAFESVITKHAMFDLQGDRARVEPVVYTLAFFQQPHVFALTLQKHDDVWRVVSLEDGLDLPQEYVSTLPDQNPLHFVRVTLRDSATGAPVHARVHVEDARGEYWPPAGHMKFFPHGFNENVGGDVIVDGRPFAYVMPAFELPLAAGRYRMEVRKGMEYEPAVTEFEVRADDIPEIEIAMNRRVDMNARGWYSGDTHVHFLSPAAALLEARAEDLNVVNILATKWGELFTNVVDFTGAASRESDADHIIYVNEEARHAHLGHTDLLNLKRLVHPLAWGGNSLSNSAVHGGLDYPAMGMLASAARAQGGLVSWAHFPNPGAEIAVDFALGVVDAVDLLTWGDPLAGAGDIEAATDAYYRLLNAGFRVPVLGGTDKMFNSQITGSVRTYVKAVEPFSYASWIDGIRAGRTFATNGPLLTLTVDRAEPGATIALRRPGIVTVNVLVESPLPVDTVEVILNGDVVVRKEYSDDAARREFAEKVRLRTGSWIAARAYSDRVLGYQSFPPYIPPARHFAHTSPVYLEVKDRGTQSGQALHELLAQVDQLIEWAKTGAKFADDAQRDEMLRLFRHAKDVYQRLLAVSQPQE